MAYIYAIRTEWVKGLLEARLQLVVMESVDYKFGWAKIEGFCTEH